MDPGHGDSAGALQVRAARLRGSVSVSRREQLELSHSYMALSCLFLNLYSELQGSRLNGKFLCCCEKWVQLLEKVEEMLKLNIADSLPALLEQLKTCEVNLSPPGGPHPGPDSGKDRFNKIQRVPVRVCVSNFCCQGIACKSLTFHNFQDFVLLPYFIKDRTPRFSAVSGIF